MANYDANAPRFNPTLADPALAARLAPNIVDPNIGGRPMINVNPTIAHDITNVPTEAEAQVANNMGFNHFFMQFAEHFDPFIQKKTLANPRFWHDRIPRGSFPLFQGTNPKTFIYRGGLTKYAGLADWDPIDVTPLSPGSPDPCDVPNFSTYNYAWETLQYDGHRTAWGSDPICVDALKYQDQVQTQLAWILETGAEFGVAIQEVWNRDTYIRHSVLHDRSFLMSKDYTGAGSARYVYDPFVKFTGTTTENSGNGVANSTVINKPFIVFDASVDVEPLNFDTLERVGYELGMEAPEHAVGNGADGPTFALMAASDDMEKYFRGNEEYRKYWIESKPEALIDGYGLRMKTFRGWAIVPDGNQLRFRVVRHIASYTDNIAADYGHVGYKQFQDKEVFIAEVVPPRIEGRTGINGSRVPAVNPEYYTAELAIAPVFMNNIITNLFVPQVTTLGSGTHFGAVPGLNGNWGWLNIVDRETNPFGKKGNFYGIFEIFQRPEPSVFYALSFLYRRCAQSLRSRCPAENPNVNMELTTAGKTQITKIASGGTVATTDVTTANAQPVALMTFNTAEDVDGMNIGAAVKIVEIVASDSTTKKELTGAYVTRKTNSCRIEVAVPITSTAKYGADGVFEYASGTDLLAGEVELALV